MIYSACVLISLIAMRDKSHTTLRLDSNSNAATEVGPERNSSCEDDNSTANHTTFVNALMDAPKTYTTDESGQQCKQRSP